VDPAVLYAGAPVNPATVSLGVKAADTVRHALAAFFAESVSSWQAAVSCG
jgi:hypothetical protein